MLYLESLQVMAHIAEGVSMLLPACGLCDLRGVSSESMCKYCSTIHVPLTVLGLLTVQMHNS